MFGVESFCGVCRTELIYDLWQILVFMVLNIVVPVAIMSVMYVCSIRTIRKEARKLREKYGTFTCILTHVHAFM